MFKNLFRRSASAAALIVPECETAEGWLAEQEREAAKSVENLAMDQTMVLHRGDLAALRLRFASASSPTAAEVKAAQERVAELEALLQSQVVEIEAFKALKPAKARATRKIATPKPAKPVKLSALEFWALHGQAVDNIRMAYGERWDLAPHGQTELATLPTKFRSYVNAKGAKVVHRKLVRVPAAQFWTDEALPHELATVADPVRVTEREVNPVLHDDAWHLAHGYEWFEGIPANTAIVKNGVVTMSAWAAGWVHAIEMPMLEGRRLAVLESKAVEQPKVKVKKLKAA